MALRMRKLNLPQATGIGAKTVDISICVPSAETTTATHAAPPCAGSAASGTRAHTAPIQKCSSVCETTP